MAVHYCKLNQIVDPIIAVVLVSLLDQINKVSGTWYVAIDLTNVSFCIPIKKENQFS